MTIKIWRILLAIFLVLWALLQISNLQIQLAPVILGGLAIAAAVFVVLDR